MRTFWIVMGVLLVLTLVGAWWIDRDAKRRGMRVSHVRHTGLRREIQFERITDESDDTTDRGH